MPDDLNIPPWRQLGVSGREVNPIPSMIAPDESLYLHWLARCRYTGQGEIIDGGPLLGGSTTALASGLRLNPGVVDKAGRIHSYDLFEYIPQMKRLFRRGEPAPGENLAPRFMQYTIPWQEHICVYPGDIQKRSWCGKPVEIFFIDLAKTWGIQLHLLRNFFGSLIPGVSVVVQQDYFFVSCYWIHLIMEYLSPYFRPTDMPDGPTLAFQYYKAVPPELLNLDYSRMFSKAEAALLMDRALSRFTGAKRLVATTAKVALLLASDDVKGASDTLEAIRNSPDFGEAVKIDFEKAESRVEAQRKRA